MTASTRESTAVAKSDPTGFWIAFLPLDEGERGGQSQDDRQGADAHI